MTCGSCRCAARTAIRAPASSTRRPAAPTVHRRRNSVESPGRMCGRPAAATPRRRQRDRRQVSLPSISPQVAPWVSRSGRPPVQPGVDEASTWSDPSLNVPFVAVQGRRGAVVAREQVGIQVAVVNRPASPPNVSKTRGNGDLLERDVCSCRQRPKKNDSVGNVLQRMEPPAPRFGMHDAAV